MNVDKQIDKSPNSKALRILKIDASSRYDGSVTRQLANDFIAELQKRHDAVVVQQRDVVSDALAYIDADWVNANFTPADQRSEAQLRVLAQSDQLVKELQEADVLVLGAPMYNFSIPAALKAWIDLVARAGLTFRYTENGPVGLLENKKAYVVLASGGTPIGSEIDYASGYLRHVLGFLGIHDVELISAERMNFNDEESKQHAGQQIQHAVEQLQEKLRSAA
ncbi:FMN-dependent NADH-azoreductase [Kaarinaea lacus]